MFHPVPFSFGKVADCFPAGGGNTRSEALLAFQRPPLWLSDPNEDEYSTHRPPSYFSHPRTVFKYFSLPCRTPREALCFAWNPSSLLCLVVSCEPVDRPRGKAHYLMWKRPQEGAERSGVLPQKVDGMRHPGMVVSLPGSPSPHLGVVISVPDHAQEKDVMMKFRRISSVGRAASRVIGDTRLRSAENQMRIANWDDYRGGLKLLLLATET